MPVNDSTSINNVIVYGIVPRNFDPPAFISVAAKMPYLQNLGINAVWLSPINQTTNGDFGYAVTDYFAVRPDYGTEADLGRLVQTAHEHGIRILMDFVPNHTSAQHPYYQDAQARGQASPFYTYYDRDEAGAVTHYFDWTHLPNLNYHNPVVERWMLDALTHWVREFDVDGFRVDAAWGIRQRQPDVWPRWCSALKQLKPDLLLLAEASARDPFYVTHGFDAAYDWTDELGHAAWEHVFDDRELLVDRLHAALTNQGRGFDPASRIFRFLNNNDTGPRFVTRHGLALTRVATALLLTLPGLPCIYMGDEVGAEWQPYAKPQPIVWDDRHDLRAYHQRLIALRKRCPSLRSPHWQPVTVTDAEQVYAYMRYVENSEQPILVVLNFASSEQQPAVQIPPQFGALHSREMLRDLLADESLAVGGVNVRIPIAGSTARVLAAPAE